MNKMHLPKATILLRNLWEIKESFYFLVERPVDAKRSILFPSRGLGLLILCLLPLYLNVNLLDYQAYGDSVKCLITYVIVT